MIKEKVKVLVCG